MDDKFRRLIELGAGEFEHVDGKLIEHLEGTRCLLKAWSASNALQDAGLYHAAYGTSAFEQNLFDLIQRKEVKDIIGEAAEKIVYHYCACDREPFFAQFGQIDELVFYDRFTGDKASLDIDLLTDLCELTAANEIEIALQNPSFMEIHGEGLLDLFTRMGSHLTLAARRKVRQVFSTSEL